MMTRINVILPSQLTSPHLVAEYRELPRAFGLAKRAHERGWTPDKAPQSYLLGTGHVTFFYDKLAWCARRHVELVREMEARGYLPLMRVDPQRQQLTSPASLWGDWTPTPDAVRLNMARLRERDPENYA